MMERDQPERVGLTLCRRAGVPEWWKDGRPSKEALDACEGKHDLSEGEVLLVRVAVDVWNGHGWASVGRVLNILDTDNLRAVGSLLVALADGSAAVERWLVAQEAELAERARRGFRALGEPKRP